MSEWSVNACKRKGRETDDVLHEYLKKNQGSSVYSASRGLEWSTGRVAGSVSRLENRGLVRREKIEKEISPGSYKIVWSIMVISQ